MTHLDLFVPHYSGSSTSLRHRTLPPNSKSTWKSRATEMANPLLPCCFSRDKTWWWTLCLCSLLAVSSLFAALLHLCSFISKDWSQQQVSVSNENRVRLGFHFYLKSEASLLQIIRSLELWNHKRHRPLANLGEHGFPVTKRRGVSKRNRISSDPQASSMLSEGIKFLLFRCSLCLERSPPGI